MLARAGKVQRDTYPERLQYALRPAWQGLWERARGRKGAQVAGIDGKTWLLQAVDEWMGRRVVPLWQKGIEGDFGRLYSPFWATNAVRSARRQL